MISERKKYIAKMFLNKCSATDTMRQHLKFHLKFMENSHKLSENDLADIKKKYNVDNYIERLIPLIDEHFTIEEMQEAIKFYSSKVGRKMSDPNFLNKISNVGDKIDSEMSHEFDIADEQMNNFKERILEASNQKKVILETSNQRKIIFKNSQSPGDILMLTAAVRDLKLSHPNILIDVRTSAGEIWENNPYLTDLDENNENVEIYEIGYPLIHTSNQGQYHFIHGFRCDIEEKLKLKIKSTDFKGEIFISEQEKSWMSQIEEKEITNDFWIVMAGGKYDFTAKWWNPDYYQEVINHFKDKITFAQCGEKKHWHPKLKGAINLIGKTDFRQFIRLIYHSVGVLCPITFAMHAAEAIESKKGLRHRPCVVISGGREPSQWEKYPHHRFLETNGAIDCCSHGGCWKSRCQKVGDGDDKDTEGLCKYPIKINDDLIIPKCMDMIKPFDVIRAIEMYYEGGILKYND